MDTIELYFKKFCTERQLAFETRRQPGIYIVYALTKLYPRKGYEFREILYIGESENISKRLATKKDPEKGLEHEKYKDWTRELNNNESLIFSIAYIKSLREQTEAALIYYHHKYYDRELPCNEQNKKSFDYPDTHIKISGHYDLLNPDFILMTEKCPDILS